MRSIRYLPLMELVLTCGIITAGLLFSPLTLTLQRAAATLDAKWVPTETDYAQEIRGLPDVSRYLPSEDGTE